MSCRTRPTTRPWATCRTRWPRPTTPTTRARPSCCTSWPWPGKGDFALANRLYRDRNALSARPPWPTWPWASRPWTARPRPRRFWASWRSGTSTTRPRAATPAQARCPGAIRRPSCGPLRLGDRRGLAEIAQGQGTGRLAHGPSHRQPLGPGKGDRPRRAGLVPLVRRQPLHRRALQADRLRQRRAGQGAGHRSGRRQPVDRRAATIPQAGREGQAAGQLPDRRPRTLHLSVHPRRFRAGRQAQEHDRQLAGRRATTSRPRWNSTAARSPAVSACWKAGIRRSAIRSISFPSAAAAW